MSERLSPHAALIYVMVVMAAADRRMSDREMKMIGTLVQSLPVFGDFDPERLVQTSEDCAALLGGADGLDKVLSRVRASLPENLRETAYALAVEVAAADGKASQEELRLLEIIRHTLPVERLAAAAIERGAHARFATL